MGNFVPDIEFRKRFDGDDVVVKARRLRRLEMMTALPLIQEVMNLRQGGKKNSQKTQIATLKMLDEVGPLATKAIKSVEGITDASGNPVSAETIMGEIYFTELATDIIGDIFNSSSLGPEDEKS